MVKESERIKETIETLETQRSDDDEDEDEEKMGHRFNSKHEPSKKKGGSSFATKLEKMLTMRRMTD
jgi:hypothetical protein